MTNSKIRNFFAVDRTSNHPLVNRTVTVCYDEWNIGTNYMVQYKIRRVSCPLRR